MVGCFWVNLNLIAQFPRDRVSLGPCLLGPCLTIFLICHVALLFTMVLLNTIVLKFALSQRRGGRGGLFGRF